jgi:SAM-dependent methyltransferase
MTLENRGEQRAEAEDHERKNELESLYNKSFYLNQSQGSASSAGIIVPYIMELFPFVKSVIDIGCGTGGWLHEFQKFGVNRIRGLDGGDLDHSLLKIDPSCFQKVDLTDIPPEPRYDLVLCLEVAEHLPVDVSEKFIKSLCGMGDLIVFSAAIPGQGGHNHVNERWLSFWVKLFSDQGYDCHDLLRGKIWDDDNIAWWYRQNLVVFKKRTNGGEQLPATAPIDIVHPRCFAAHHANAFKSKKRKTRKFWGLSFRF